MAADRTSEHRLTPAEPGTGLDPDEVGRKTFETTFRGFDPHEVQAYLLVVANELRAVRERCVDLEVRLAEAERAAEQAAAIDEQRLTAALGDEVASILDAARAAAAKLRAQAEIDAAELVRAGEEQAARLRQEAEQQLELRTAEARQAAAAIEQEAEALRVQAQIDAAAEIEAGKQTGREMVAEAQIVRERILKDLARRRRQARQQIEQLRAGRERLLEAYRVVRETMERATEELEISLPAAKAAAETAGRSVPDDDELSVQQLESMLDAARDAGLIDARAASVEAEIEADVEAAGDEGSEPAAEDAAGVGASSEAAEQVEEGEEAAEADEADEAVAEADAEAADVDAESGEGVEEADVASERGAAWTGRSRRWGKAARIVAEERAEPPLEGRRSSSVRVFRRDDAVDEPVSEGAEPVAEAEVLEAELDVAEVADAPVAAVEPPPVASDEPGHEVGREAAVDDTVDEEVVVEVVEEIVEIEADAEGEGDEVVVVEEVVEVVTEDEIEAEVTEAGGEAEPADDDRVAADAQGSEAAEEADAAVDEGAPTGEVITGLFARIKADHADSVERSARSDEGEGRSPRRRRRANGNGNGHADANGHGQPPTASPADEAKASDASDQPEPAAAGPVAAAAEPAAEVTAEATAADPADDDPSVRRDRALAGPSRGLGRALKRVVADEQNEVLDLVRREKRKELALDDLLPEASEHALRYAAAAKPELADAAYAGATFADEGASVRPDVDDLAAELSLAVVSQLRTRFESALTASAGDRDALLDELRSTYRDTKGRRVDECVHHFAGEAFNRGVRAASPSDVDDRLLVDAGAKPSLG